MAGYKAFLSETSKFQEDRLILDPQESHHLCRVLRASVDSVVEVLDGKGKVYQAKLIEANPRNAELLVNGIESYLLPKTELVLLMSIPKPKAMDQILKRAVEIGIQKIIPVFSEHSAFVLSPEQMEAKLNKWQIVLIESCKQSSCPFLPTLNMIGSLEQFFLEYASDWKHESLGVVASLENDAELLWNDLSNRYGGQKKVIYAVGPEGDFSKNEYKAFNDLGFTGSRLGAHVLRSETAVTYGLSVIDQFLKSR